MAIERKEGNGVVELEAGSALPGPRPFWNLIRMGWA